MPTVSIELIKDTLTLSSMLPVGYMLTDCSMVPVGYMLTDIIDQNFTVSNYMYFHALLIGANLARKIFETPAINQQITKTT